MGSLSLKTGGIPQYPSASKQLIHERRLTYPVIRAILSDCDAKRRLGKNNKQRKGGQKKVNKREFYKLGKAAGGEYENRNRSPDYGGVPYTKI
jgi:hypothetical protein